MKNALGSWPCPEFKLDAFHVAFTRKVPSTDYAIAWWNQWYVLPSRVMRSRIIFVDVESLALSVLRLIEKNALKERTAQILRCFTGIRCNLLLNEKRTNIQNLKNVTAFKLSCSESSIWKRHNSNERIREWQPHGNSERKQLLIVDAWSTPTNPSPVNEMCVHKQPWQHRLINAHQHITHQTPCGLISDQKYASKTIAT